LSRASKESTCETNPAFSSREMHLSLVVGQTILFMGSVFEIVRFPDLANSNSGERSMGSVQGSDTPIWSDNLRQRQEGDSYKDCRYGVDCQSFRWSLHAMDFIRGQFPRNGVIGNYAILISSHRSLRRPLMTIRPS
jgi:hypothetical protein